MDFWISPTGKFVMNLLRILNAFFFHPFSAKQMAYKTAHFALRIPIIHVTPDAFKFYPL